MNVVELEEILTLVGNNLNKTRLKKGLSLRKLAAECNVDHSDIAKIEKGQINFTIATLTQLCNALGIEVLEVFKS
jgi:transcriptional regulator with XRE-family HTH domain